MQTDSHPAENSGNASQLFTTINLWLLSNLLLGFVRQVERDDRKNDWKNACQAHYCNNQANLGKFVIGHANSRDSGRSPNRGRRVKVGQVDMHTAILTLRPAVMPDKIDLHRPAALWTGKGLVG